MRRNERIADSAKMVRINVDDDDDSAGERFNDEEDEEEEEEEEDEESFVYQVQKIGTHSEDEDSDSSFEQTHDYRHENTPTSTPVINGGYSNSFPRYQCLQNSKVCEEGPPPYSSLDVERLASDNEIRLGTVPPFDSDSASSYTRAVDGKMADNRRTSRCVSSDTGSYGRRGKKQPCDSDTGSYTRAINDSYHFGTVSDTADESSTAEYGNYTSSHSEGTSILSSLKFPAISNRRIRFDCLCSSSYLQSLKIS